MTYLGLSSLICESLLIELRSGSSSVRHPTSVVRRRMDRYFIAGDTLCRNPHFTEDQRFYEGQSCPEKCWIAYESTLIDKRRRSDLLNDLGEHATQCIYRKSFQWVP